LTRICLAVAAAAVVAALAPGAIGAPANDARLRVPKGTYISQAGRVQLAVQPGSIQLAAFSFRCGEVTGRTALNDVPVKRRRGRYRFSISAHGGVTYSDEESADNAAITFSGRFTPRAGRALGTFRIRTPRCGRTGPVDWSARRQ
jgi:hypothetical protein